MDESPTLVMWFATLDDAESALDWIGVGFTESEGAFEGVLTDDDRDLLAAAIDDADTPEPVRELALALRHALAAATAGIASWRVGFGGE